MNCFPELSGDLGVTATRTFIQTLGERLPGLPGNLAPLRWGEGRVGLAGVPEANAASVLSAVASRAGPFLRCTNHQLGFPASRGT
ncbi:MAG: hypothetical protein ACYC96_15900, partial [Fimbriimonadaceae bacterium]